jgi:hypothetical protein
MPEVIEEPSAAHRLRRPVCPLRSVRPSLMDLRFTGDPWVVDHADGTASLRLDNYPLVRLRALPFDFPFLNRTLLQLRQWQARRASLRCVARRCMA